MNGDPSKILDAIYREIGFFLTTFAQYEAGIYRLYEDYLGLSNPVVRALVGDSRWPDVQRTFKRVMVAKKASKEALEIWEYILKRERELRPFRDLCAHYPAHGSIGENGVVFIEFAGEINPNNKNPEPWEHIPLEEFKRCWGAVSWLSMRVRYHLQPTLEGQSVSADLLEQTFGPWPQLPALRRANR
ncbi:hypothetical protein AB2M62_14240 [Sphingomonas sp. MMS12-HWE2-04]|uniref:hypothetical protein n=1 Tax=Sphingomonas sp. MMS12-HWE2-04 TaxID=3234199 RepID=UPI00384E0514